MAFADRPSRAYDGEILLHGLQLDNEIILSGVRLMTQRQSQVWQVTGVWILGVWVGGLLLMGRASADPSKVRRTYRLGASTVRWDEGGISESRSVHGLIVDYDFAVSQRSTLGFHLAFRRGGSAEIVGGASALNQASYGVAIRHRILGTDGDHAMVLGYGLLQQVLSTASQQGEGRTHDTRLLIGYEGPRADWGGALFVEGAWHVARLAPWGAAGRGVHHAELAAGVAMVTDTGP